MDYFKDEAFKREVEMGFDALVVMVKSLLVGNSDVVVGLLRKLFVEKVSEAKEAAPLEKRRRGRPKTK